MHVLVEVGEAGIDEGLDDELAELIDVPGYLVLEVDELLSL